MQVYILLWAYIDRSLVPKRAGDEANIDRRRYLSVHTYQRAAWPSQPQSLKSQLHLQLTLASQVTQSPSWAGEPRQLSSPPRARRSGLGQWRWWGPGSCLELGSFFWKSFERTVVAQEPRRSGHEAKVASLWIFRLSSSFYSLHLQTPSQNTHKLTTSECVVCSTQATYIPSS